jgi:hypothetical protein
LQAGRVADSIKQATAKTKYRDLSTVAAKSAAFGRDDVWLWLAAPVEMTWIRRRVLYAE